MTNSLAKTLFLEIGRKRFEVSNLEEASRMFCVARDRSGKGASQTPTPKIVDEHGAQIGYISYNGRVWAGTAYVPDAVPLYDNGSGLRNAVLAVQS